jgi:hypothetical protein
MVVGEEEGCRKGDEPSLFSYRAGERTVVIFITSGSKGLVGGKRDGGEETNRCYFHNNRLDVPSLFS